MAMLAFGLLVIAGTTARAADVTIFVPTTFAAANVGDDSPGDPTVFTVDGNLTIKSGAAITCNDSGASGNSACEIKIVVTGKLLMEAGSSITADNNFDGGNAGNITITVGTDMTMCGPNGGQPGCSATGDPGALISAQKKSGGATSLVNSVTITVGDKLTATGNFYMEGGVTTYGAETGATIDTTSSTGHAGNINVTAGKTYFTEPGSVVQAGGHDETTTAQGGKIFLVSDCGFTTRGRVTSKGPDSGADLVHLESCTVVVEGLVESTGKGHAAAAPNSCDLVDDGLPGEVLRDHPKESTGCVEVWGNLITIDSSTVNPATGLPWAGELNADIGDGGPAGTSWIDIFASANLTVIDGTGNDRISDNNPGADQDQFYFSTYAVHANVMDGSDHNPGVVTALVKNGPLTASGKAFEASSRLNADTGHAPGPFFVGNGSDGGTIRLEALGTVTLDTAWLNASGDIVGTLPDGGHIIVSAWGNGPPKSDLLWRTVSGDVQPNSTGGTIDLNACGLIDTTGTIFHGAVPTETHVCDDTKPTIPTIAAIDGGPVFKTDLWAACGSSSIGGIKFNDLNGSHGRDVGEPVLGGWVITLWNATQTVVVATTSTAAPPDGSYTFPGVAPGTYVVCETVQPGWQQTAPVAGLGVVSCTTGGLGYTVDICSACANGTCTGTPITGKDFGNIQLATKSGTKWNDKNGNHARDLGDDGLNGWVIHLFGTAVNGNAVHQTATTSGGGNYSFTVLPGSYTVCEQGQAGWTQTFPTSGAPCTAAGDPAGDNPTPGAIGYAITLTGGQTDPGNDFGNTQPPTGCQKQTVLDTMATTYPGNLGPDTTVHTNLGESVQTAVDNASDTNHDGYIIVMVIGHADGSLGGSANQKVKVWKDYGNDQPFGLFGCSVTLTGGGAGPAVSVQSSANSKNIVVNGRTTDIFVMDLHGGNSAVGVQADGMYRYLRNEAATGNGIGIKVTGNNNTVHNGAANGNNGDGVWVSGNSNLLTDTNSMSNLGNGFNVSGNSNQLVKLDAGEKGIPNGQDGVHVVGNSNTLSEVDAYANGGDGIDVAGNSNTLNKNVAGDRNKGNKGSGIRVAGNSNPLTENKAVANTGEGFTISGGTSAGPNSLKSNVSNGGNSASDQENGGAEYNLLNYVKNNGGGNKADNIVVPKTTAPTKCTAFPATNATVNFTLASLCE